MKRKAITIKDMGSYALAYQVPGKDPLVDVCFFDGDRSITEIAKLEEALARARFAALVMKGERSPQSRWRGGSPRAVDIDGPRPVRFESLWPAALKTKARAKARALGISLNELMIRAVRAALAGNLED